MDLYKIIHYNRVSNGVPFPWFYALDEDEGRRIRREFGQHLRLTEPTPTDAELSEALAERWHPVCTEQANGGGCRLAELLDAAGIVPRETVFLDWAEDEDRFGSTIDEMRFADVAEYLTLLWYPSLDDLLLFDRSYAWAVRINLDGAVLLARDL